MKAIDCKCAACEAALHLDRGLPVMCWTEAEWESLLASGVLAGRVVVVDLAHDDDCPMQPCRCEPWRLVRPVLAAPRGADRRAS